MADNTVTVENPGRRIAIVRKLVRPLRQGMRGHVQDPPAQLVTRTTTREVIVAISEVRRASTYRDWFFKTSNEGLLGQYFEEWSTRDERTWFLSNMSLQFFRSGGPYDTPVEVLAVHSEPFELREEIRAKLKRGPHIHFKQAGKPLGAAHIPLNYCHLDHVMTSLATLMEAVGHAINVAVCEVIHADW